VLDRSGSRGSTRSGPSDRGCGVNSAGGGQGDGGGRGDGGVRAYDVFLSHNGKDKPRVRELGRALKERALNVWLDEQELQPGLPWQEKLEEGIESSSSVAVLVGNDGLGPWEDEEMRASAPKRHGALVAEPLPLYYS
jgi:hypothetical protein